jgi:periplasmic copper chaperone A
VKQVLIRVFITVLLLGACSPVNGIQIRDAWMRPAAQGANGAVYFVIQNSTSKVDEIIQVSSEIAEAVEMHESKMNGDVMQMNQRQSVPLGVNEKVTFEPGGLHIMLVGLREDLKNGDKIAITLHFKNHEDIQISVPVTDNPVSEENHSPAAH